MEVASQSFCKFPGRLQNQCGVKSVNVDSGCTVFIAHSTSYITIDRRMYGIVCKITGIVLVGQGTADEYLNEADANNGGSRWANLIELISISSIRNIIISTAEWREELQHNAPAKGRSTHSITPLSQYWSMRQ